MTDLPTIDDYMATDIISVRPDTDIYKAIKILLDNRISGAPVIDDNGKLIGILSKKDCLKVVFSASYYQDLGGRVSDHMSTDVETVDAGTSIIDLAERFLAGSYRRFPVVKRGNVVGIISRHDILKAIAEQW